MVVSILLCMEAMLPGETEAGGALGLITELVPSEAMNSPGVALSSGFLGQGWELACKGEWKAGGSGGVSDGWAGQMGTGMEQPTEGYALDGHGHAAVQGRDGPAGSWHAAIPRQGMSTARADASQESCADDQSKPKEND